MTWYTQPCRFQDSPKDHFTSALADFDKAVALGGKMLVEPHEDRHGGKSAVIADPAGAPLGLMEWSGPQSKVEPQ